MKTIRLKKEPLIFELSELEAISSLALFFNNNTFPSRKHLVIAEKNNIDKLESFLKFKNPNFPWYVLPPFPKSKSLDSEILKMKRRKWQSWAECHSKKFTLFLASPEALLKKTNIPIKSHTIKKQHEFKLSLIKDYKEKTFVESAGDFSHHGFAVDVFSPSYHTPLRIQLIGTQIQSIHLLDKHFKRREIELESALIPSLFEWSRDGEYRKNLCSHLKKQEKLLNHTLPPILFQNVARGETPSGFEALMNGLNRTCSLDAFDSPPKIWMFKYEKTKSCFFEEASKLEKEKPFFTEENLFLPWNKIEEKVEKYKTKTFSAKKFKKPKNLREYLKNLPVLHIVFTGLKIKELKRILLKENILISGKEIFFEGKSLIFLPHPIPESFFCKEDTAYIRTEDLVSQKTKNLSHFDFFRKRARALEFSKLEEGDLLVHKLHGVGVFSGLKTLRVLDKTEDFILLKYKNGDKLFVPAYKASQVYRYSNKKPDEIVKTLLDQLGNPKTWERKKSQAKKYIQNLTIELMRIYSLRKQKKRNPFDPVEKALNDFAMDFPFHETPDQKRSIKEIMTDMSKDQPMDRLLTADTGFGKTEVALRACFRVLENSLQVCFLAPTTILTLQHFENFKKRFENTPFQLELLNRFVSTKQKENIFQRVSQGEIDFLIATHSTFSPKLHFKNLGLLILDEEHRFGVRQKERLSRFKENLDILSLSATPIPRTLNMALTGIKDISVINQPPLKRKPVKIFLKSWDEGAEEYIVQACLNEKARFGQILFVHNRVKTLEKRAQYIQNLLPDFKIAVAHGQMKNLEKLILDFFKKKYDILCATNILESGMDIPQANTLFIDRAHEMGLSQIYQLKGRVGRGNRQAFCYLLFPQKDRLSPLALERLDLLSKYSGLGQSFQLALKDLENRGAGSLFGSEQSGHMQNLGEDLYFEMLNKQLADKKELYIEPEILLPFSTGISKNYIPDPRLRLLYYKNLSEAFNEEERASIRSELSEEFGPLPEELNKLFLVLEIRDLCKTLFIKDLKYRTQNLYLTFHEKSPVSPELIAELLQKVKGNMLDSQSCRIPVNIKNLSQKMKSILEALKE